MPQTTNSKAAARLSFVREALFKKESITALCRKYQFSRAAGHKWLRRYHESGAPGLADRRRGPGDPQPGAACRRWAALILRQREATGWGARKLGQWLRHAHRGAKLPSERTLARLLLREGCLGIRRPRRRPGPRVPAPTRVVPTRCHEVWTMDFKGHFKTRDGSRCDPLTVRDLFSRCVLLIEHVPAQSDAAVRGALQRCFERHGLPAQIRVDNGAPFGGHGPLGLSRLSVWWRRLGIETDFSRPAKPQDNGAHEQMHRVLKAATASPPAATLRGQAQRFARFCRHYNEERPHDALEGRVPQRGYRRNARRYREPPSLHYPSGWLTLFVRPGGRVRWGGRERVVGRAFAGQTLGLRRKASTPGNPDEVVEVYLGDLPIGELHASDQGGMRWAQWERAATAQTPATAEG